MQSRKFDTVVTAVSVALLGYFAWHASLGPRGFAYRENLAAEAAAIRDKLRGLQEQRLAFDQHVSLLRPESIDPDLLDELARSQLGMAAPNEVVVLGTGAIPQGNP